MRRYETIVIVRPGVGETDLTPLTEKVTGIIESFGGSIVKLDRWGIKKLAYTINKETQGNYFLFEYAGAPEGVKELERQMRIDDRILKFMTIKTQDVFSEMAPVDAVSATDDEENTDEEEEEELA